MIMMSSVIKILEILLSLSPTADLSLSVSISHLSCNSPAECIISAILFTCNLTPFPLLQVLF